MDEEGEEYEKVKKKRPTFPSWIPGIAPFPN
jgi:hypothetical protein